MSLYEQYKNNYQQIPVVINCRDYVSYTKNLTEYFLSIGFTDIRLLDNDSSYPPLLAWYESLAGSPHVRVIKLGENKGHHALWDNRVPQYVEKDTPFFYTDPDIMPISACPPDFALAMLKALDEYPHFTKCGLEIDTDSFSNTFIHKASQLAFNRLIKSELLAHEVYASANDTTLALYRPNSGPCIYCVLLGAPYKIKHLPWCIDSTVITEEQRYYMDHAKNAVTSLKDPRRTEKLVIDLIRRRNSGESLEQIFNAKSKNIFAKLRRSVCKHYWRFMDKHNLDKTDYFSA